MSACPWAAVPRTDGRLQGGARPGFLGSMEVDTPC